MKFYFYCSFYCGYCYVTELRNWLPDSIGSVTWMGLDEPYNTCFVPFYAGALDLPTSYQTGNTSNFNKNTAWWAFNFVSNLSALKFSYMKEDIQKIQKHLEATSFAKQAQIEAEALRLYKKDPKSACQYLTKYSNENASYVVNKWWKLSTYLIEKYADGCINKPHPYREVGYPKSWLHKTEYKNGPTSYKKKPLD